MVESRREHTTALIRKAAIEEFTEIGSRALTLRSVAGRAHISNGAVYQRWPDKAACITDLVTNELPARTAAVRARWESPGHSLDELVREDLTDPVQLRELRFMVECVLAGVGAGRHHGAALSRPVLRRARAGGRAHPGDRVVGDVDMARSGPAAHLSLPCAGGLRHGGDLDHEHPRACRPTRR